MLRFSNVHVLCFNDYASCVLMLQKKTGQNRSFHDLSSLSEIYKLVKILYISSAFLASRNCWHTVSLFKILETAANADK